jgi:hypothetical protein
MKMGRPAVTSQFLRTRAASPVSIGARVLALIGKGSDSFTIQEAIVRGSGSNDTLGHTATSFVKVGNYKGTAEYALTTDYTLDGGAIKWVSSNKPTTGATYYVTYVYSKVAADYEPFLTDSFSDVVTICGDIVLSSGALTNDSYLTAAAQIAFDVGVRQVIICQVEANTPAKFKEAYDKLENTVDGINPYYIIPLLGSLATSGDFDTAKGTAFQHCQKMASEEFGKERQLYTGKKDYTLSGFAVDDFVNEATAVASSRMILSGNYNPIRVISQPTGSVNVELDGCFMAVMLASFRTTQFASDPMMNRAIPGAFTGFSTTWGDIEIDTLVDGGVCVCEEIGGILKVVDDITTDTSDEIEVDIATVEARDVLISMNRKAVDGRFKGARGENSVSDQLRAFEDSFLDQRVGEGLIAAKGSISAARVPGSIRKWIITFGYLPVTKVRDIVIKFSVDLGLAI